MTNHIYRFPIIFSANSRLERLRQSLFIQQEASASSSDSGNKAKSLGMASPGPPSTLELNNSNNSVFHSASNTIDDGRLCINILNFD